MVEPVSSTAGVDIRRDLRSEQHGEPGRTWRLGELAKQTGMSRTSFALRFKANAGVAPLTYEARSGIQQARLRGYDSSVGIPSPAFMSEGWWTRFSPDGTH